MAHDRRSTAVTVGSADEKSARTDNASNGARWLTGHMPQLDGLRAVAVGAILWHHWMPQKYQGSIPWAAGVQLFFVLSGFLITGLLLDARGDSERFDGARIVRIWRNFYLRRALRLFPLYYLVLACLAVAGMIGIGEQLVWHVFYASNYYIIVQGQWITFGSHFWTLAVEEQFYLCWPLLVLLVPLRRMGAVLMLVVAVGPLFRAFGGLWFPQIRMWWLATPAQFDALGIGALLAWFVRHPTERWQWLVSRRRLVLIGVGGLYVACISTSWMDYRASLSGLWLCVVFGCLVYAAATRQFGRQCFGLENPMLRYVGRISYGVYLLHPFAVSVASFAWSRWPLLATIPGAWYLLEVGFTFGTAALSWHFLERPVNRLKTFFPY